MRYVILRVDLSDFLRSEYGFRDRSMKPVIFASDGTSGLQMQETTALGACVVWLVENAISRQYVLDTRKNKLLAIKTSNYLSCMFWME